MRCGRVDATASASPKTAPAPAAPLAATAASSPPPPAATPAPEVPAPASSPPPATSPLPAPVPGANHYLILGWRDAVELVPGRRFVIGRGAGVNLRVPHMDVSRQHAAVEWDGPSPVLRDLSGKLTEVNEQPVPGAGSVLRDGDTIRLGPSFAVSYRNVTERQLTYDVFGADKQTAPTIAAAPANGAALIASVPPPAAPPPPIPQAIDGAEPEPAFTDVAPDPDDPGGGEIPLEGDFAATPAAVVLASIFERKLTGGLIISRAPGTGALRIEKGRVKGVVFRMRTGQEAAEEVKALTQGTYRFVKE